jgi:uncharacterized membrane protein
MIRKTTPERLSFFSDAIFAVLITVLVLELRPPEQPTFEALLERWPTWLSYAVSYLFIAIATLCLFAIASLVALKYPVLGLGICCCCLIGYLRPGAPATN